MAVFPPLPFISDYCHSLAIIEHLLFRFVLCSPVANRVQFLVLLIIRFALDQVSFHICSVSWFIEFQYSAVGCVSHVYILT